MPRSFLKMGLKFLIQLGTFEKCNPILLYIGTDSDTLGEYCLTPPIV